MVFRINTKIKIRLIVVLVCILFSVDLFAQSEVTFEESTIVMTQSELNSFLNTIANARRTEINEREREQQKRYLADLRMKYQDGSGIRSGAYDNTSYQQILNDLRYLNDRINNLSANRPSPSISRDNSTILLPGGASPSTLNQPNVRGTTTVIPSNNKIIQELKERIDSLKNVESKMTDYPNDNSFADSLNIMKGNLNDVRREMVALESKLSAVVEPVDDGAFFKQHVFFENNSINIIDEFYPYIQDLTQILINYPEAKVLIEGWASPVGNVNYNKKLSMQRAEAVEQAFINNRIDKSRIITSFRGEDRTSSEQYGRRVDMSIILR